MADLVTYDRNGVVSTVTMDDGKVNVFSFDMLRALHEAFDQAERDETVVLLTGRPGYFSAGFDLKVLRDGGAEATRELLALGATLAERILLFPAPVVVACPGHAFPAGAFLLMAADERIGAAGPFKLGLNEVRIGLTLPWFAIVLARHRLTPTHFDHVTVTGTMFDPEGPGKPGCSTRWWHPRTWNRPPARRRTTWRRWTAVPTPARNGGRVRPRRTSCVPRSRPSWRRRRRREHGAG